MTELIIVATPVLFHRDSSQDDLFLFYPAWNGPSLNGLFQHYPFLNGPSLNGLFQHYPFLNDPSLNGLRIRHSTEI